LSASGVSARRTTFEPLMGVMHVHPPVFDRCPLHLNATQCAVSCVLQFEEVIRREDPETVAAVIVENRQVQGIRLADGSTLQSRYVVNSSGAWGTQLARTIGVELPMQPVKRHVFILETPVQPEHTVPLTVFPSGLYIIHEHERRFMVGKSLPDDLVGFDFTFNRQVFLDGMWEDLAHYIPAFDQVKIVGGWAGLYAVNTLDGNAILGEWPEIKGFILVNGFSGHGFQQCCGVGRYLAEIILGREPALDLSIFSPARILRNTPVYENRHRIV
ncbi:MAG: FAD-binding oxidoreductase, partial [Anaerolineae bacterium]|nr:FAD-binding oxidoreductase [Anaerolineae bacterium]